ncbi:ATP-dependent Clp protease ATP-binding subunit [Gloeobacter violaceus]|uniref:Endopeptidase Clp ATP-binding chain n=1 Tax=Gloeobacter violaceus (strain ATCC 29082 / PCC 7421) TaxID=251221 RepID=Q7NKD6_GLOVI|nr:ATP-dependent Clp protease ATP-binding subunit [Gloeobacter violaceus]BAC89483.1 endopeptidase Clp ATP-binding chain [Gloeobacter violaceus PCC 7421]
MFEQFSPSALQVLNLAKQESLRLGQNAVGTEQLLLGLLAHSDAVAAQVLTELGLSLAGARREVESIVGKGESRPSQRVAFTPRAGRLIEQALIEANGFGQRLVEPEHLLLSMLRDNEGVASRVLDEFGVDRDKARQMLLESLGDAAKATSASRGNEQPRRSDRASRSGGPLERFGRDLTELARGGKIDPVVGRAEQIERVIQILGRRTKNNPVLIGEPGVGKTAIAEGLAVRIAEGDVPEMLFDRRIVSLDMGQVLAGTQMRGEFEERLKGVMQEVIASKGQIVLFIDELHTLVGAGASEGGMDAANLLKPALARGELQCIGATTLDEYRKHIERDAALERRFQPVTVGEPSVDEAIAILQGLKVRYEEHHKLRYTDAALEAAVRLSDRYIADRFLPDKAIDLIDEAGSMIRVKLARGAELPAIVDSEAIAQVLSEWTNIPVGKLTGEEATSLVHLEARLHERIIGQHPAVSAVARAVRRARAGMKSPERPQASFIFAGPTGVGKTELAKALAATVFGSEDAMIRLDMSEFMESYTVSKLIGSPPGYVGYDEGGQLTEAVRRRPYTVILLDEIEKAHPDVFNILLQLLDDGRLTDAKGRTVSFKNALIIMTSNLGSRVIERGGGGLGFNTTGSAGERRYVAIRDRVQEELKQVFRPEFLNRLDEVIVFQPLDREELGQVARLLLNESLERVRELGIELEASPAFIDKVIAEGYSPAWGARPLRRAVQRLLEDSVADAVLLGRLVSGERYLVDVDADGKVIFIYPDLADAKAEMAMSAR